MVIGLYGGVGAGKSTVAELFGELGAVVLDADAAVHEAYADAAVREAVQARFGADVYRPDGSLDRPALARRVFADEPARRDLEALVHPVVRERLLARFEAAQEAGALAVVLDVPLLATSPLESLADVRIFVDAPAEVREQRAQQHRGWAPGEVQRRDAAQPRLEERRRRCSYTIVNDAQTSRDDLRRQVREVWAAVKERIPRS